MLNYIFISQVSFRSAFVDNAFLSAANPALTLCATHLAGLHETQQGNEVFNDAEVLGP